MTRYRAQRITDERWGQFDSLSEYNRWLELRVLFEGGLIASLVRQREFVLSESPKCVYTADAAYFERDGREPNVWHLVAEDVKPQGGAQSRDVFVRVCWLLNHAEHNVTAVRLLRRGTARATLKRGERPVAGWLVREYRATKKRSRRAAA